LGVRGDIQLMTKEWNWDISASYGEVKGLQIQDGNLSRSRLQSALNNPAALASRGCASFNPFGTLSAACGAAIAIRTTNSLEFSQSQVVAYATGDVIDLPAGPLGASVGFEYRRDVGTFRPDEFLRSGDVVGFNANQPINGEINVREYFTEIAVPLLRDAGGRQPVARSRLSLLIVQPRWQRRHLQGRPRVEADRHRQGAWLVQQGDACAVDPRTVPAGAGKLPEFPGPVLERQPAAQRPERSTGHRTVRRAGRTGELPDRQRAGARADGRQREPRS
jgi:hypothetical protein